MRPSSTEAHVSQILNAAWLVRHYARGARGQSNERGQAIKALALAVRESFTQCDDQDFEVLLAAIVDGLRPRDLPPF